MADQIRSSRTSPDVARDKSAEGPSAASPQEAAERLRDEIDDLLDEIDEVLETNSEEFVRNYVQKGGE